MPKDEKVADSVSEPAPTTGAESQQRPSQNETVETTPANSQTENKGESSAQNSVSDSQQNPAETAKKMLEPFMATLEDQTKSAAARIRDVLQKLHEQDSNVLNGDLYPELKYIIAKKLDVSKTLVDNNKKVVLQKINEDDSDKPIYPAGPKDQGASKQQQPTGPAPSTGGGAPFQAGMSKDSTSQSQTLDGDQGATSGPVIKWTPDQVKFLFRFLFRMLNKMFKEWDLLTEEEEKDLGKLLPPIFDKMFPATEGQQNTAMLAITMASIFGPRVIKVVEPRLPKKKATQNANPNSTTATAPTTGAAPAT